MNQDREQIKISYKGFWIKQVEGLKYQVERQAHLTFTTLDLAKKFIDETFKRQPNSKAFNI